MKKHDKNVPSEDLKKKDEVRKTVKGTGFFSDGLLAKVRGKGPTHSTATPGRARQIR